MSTSTLPAPPLLELDDVAYRYPGGRGVGPVSLRLRPGRVLGLLGPNGCGKSTLVRLAAGLHRPQAGSARLAGRDLAALPRRDIARRLALVPQQAPLPDAVTGWELVLAGRAPHLGWLAAEGPRDEAVARRALALVGAEGFAGRRLGDLSGGERQRLLLARALAQEPDVLLLDEPTAHLDLPHQLAILDLVGALARDAGLAVLAVFHDLNLAAAHCDRILLLGPAGVVAQGEPGAVLTPDRIAAAYGLRVRVLPHPESGRPLVLLPPAARHRPATTAGVPRGGESAGPPLGPTAPTAIVQAAAERVALGAVP